MSSDHQYIFKVKVAKSDTTNCCLGHYLGYKYSMPTHITVPLEALFKPGTFPLGCHFPWDGTSHGMAFPLGWHFSSGMALACRLSSEGRQRRI